MSLSFLILDNSPVYKTSSIGLYFFNNLSLKNPANPPLWFFIEFNVSPRCNKYCFLFFIPITICPAVFLTSTTFIFFSESEIFNPSKKLSCIGIEIFSPCLILESLFKSFLERSTIAFCRDCIDFLFLIGLFNISLSFSSSTNPSCFPFSTLLIIPRRSIWRLINAILSFTSQPSLVICLRAPLSANIDKYLDALIDSKSCNVNVLFTIVPLTFIAIVKSVFPEINSFGLMVQLKILYLLKSV